VTQALKTYLRGTNDHLGEENSRKKKKLPRTEKGYSKLLKKNDETDRIPFAGTQDKGRTDFMTNGMIREGSWGQP